MHYVEVETNFASILDVIFVGERGLSFTGENHLVGNPRNGNFLGILELLSNYNLSLKDYTSKIKESQIAHSRRKYTIYPATVKTSCSNPSHMRGTIFGNRSIGARDGCKTFEKFPLPRRRSTTAISETNVELRFCSLSGFGLCFLCSFFFFFTRVCIYIYLYFVFWCTVDTVYNVIQGISQNDRLSL